MTRDVIIKHRKIILYYTILVMVCSLVDKEVNVSFAVRVFRKNRLIIVQIIYHQTGIFAYFNSETKKKN